MARTIVGLFDAFDEAQHVVQDLVDNGISRADISLVANDARGEYADRGDEVAEGAGKGAVGGGVLGGTLGLLAGLGALAIPGIGPVLAAGPLAAALGGAAVGAGVGAAAGGLISALNEAGVPDEDASYFAEGVRRGGTLVMVRTTDDLADLAANIMQRHDVVDIDERSATWRQAGWSRFDANAEPYTSREIDRFSTTRPATRTAARDTTGETVLPVVEEELQVGKREVQRGGVRIHTKVEERPVEEQVHLREERVHVERRPVDRPISDADLNAFQEASFEVTETAEEAVVSKQARVVEEVIVNKDVQERTETVRDTVRRQDVHVHEQDTARAVGTSSFDTFDTDFHNHFQTNFTNSGYTYDQYSPIYRYGYELAGTEQYRGREWADIEADARKRWEDRNPGTWEQLKDAVHYAWDRARGAR